MTGLRHSISIIIYFLTVLVIGVYLISIAGVNFYSAGAILLSAFLALSAALTNISYTRRTARESNSLTFQQSLLNSQEYEKNIDVVIKAIFNRLNFPIKDYAEAKHANTEEAKAIRYVLNSWEQAANAIKHNIYDEAYLYKSHKSTVLKIGLSLRGYIEEKQKSNISFFDSFNWLVLKWTIKRDSFQEKETKRQLKKVFSDLNKIKSGQISSWQK